MKATIPWFGVLACVLSTASVQANPGCCGPTAYGDGDPCCICCNPCAPNRWCFAPDMCNPGFQLVNHYGAVYGPCHYVKPNFEPFNGILPGMKVPIPGCGPGCGPNFVTHPYVRSPRDFFMMD